MRASELVYDVFGRLVEVGERLDNGTFAPTTYEYDHDGRLLHSVDPEGVTTQIAYNFVGLRTSITRAERVWSYRYDDSGNLMAEIAPHPEGEDASLYTTSFVYDDLDRLTSRSPAPLGMSLTEQGELGVGLTVHEYDTGENGHRPAPSRDDADRDHRVRLRHARGRHGSQAQL